jgi:hypothetical protein
MGVAVVLLCGSVASLLVPGMPVGTGVGMTLASCAGWASARLDASASHLAAGGAPEAEKIARQARALDDVALALCVLALLFALPL